MLCKSYAEDSGWHLLTEHDRYEIILYKMIVRYLLIKHEKIENYYSYDMKDQMPQPNHILPRLLVTSIDDTNIST